MTRDATPEISVSELRDRLTARDEGEGFLILDVREAFELEISQLPDIEVAHVPLDEVFVDSGRRVAQLAAGREVFVLCRSGARSDQATQFLVENGIPARNIAGGILAWSAQIDPSVPIY